MRNLGLVQQLHLFLGGAHEEETGGIEELRIVSTEARTRAGGTLTKGVRYWKLLGLEPSMLTVLLSRSTKEISMIRVSAAAIRV